MSDKRQRRQFLAERQAEVGIIQDFAE